MQSSDISLTNCNKSPSSSDSNQSPSNSSDEKILCNGNDNNISFINNSANELLETKSPEKQNGVAEVLEVLEADLRSISNSEKTRHNSANTETDNNSFTSSNESLFQLNRSYLRALQKEGYYYDDEGSNVDNDNINFTVSPQEESC